MSDFIIVTDTSIDIPDEIIKNDSTLVFPISVIMGDEEFKCDLGERKTLMPEFYSSMKKGLMPTVSIPSSDDIHSFLDDKMPEGKDILYIGASEKYFEIHDRFKTALDLIKEKNPDRKCNVYPSGTSSVGLGFLLLPILAGTEDINSISEAIHFLDERKALLHQYVMVEDTFHLKRGGIFTGNDQITSNAMKIRPILTLSEDGSVIAKSRVRGTNQAMDYLAGLAVEEAGNEKLFIIGHANAQERASRLAEVIKEKLTDAECIITDIGPVAGTYLGSGAITIAF